MAKVLSTVLVVVIAVAASAFLWIGANLVFNQVRRHFERFTALVFGAVGFALGAILNGNQLTRGSGGGDQLWLNCLLGSRRIGSRDCPWGEMGTTFVETAARWLWLPALMAVVFAVFGVVLGRATDPRQRLTIGIVAGAAIGVFVGVMMKEEYYPELNVVALVGWTLGIALVGGLLSAARKRALAGGVITGAAIGWLLGSWGMADFGDGSLFESILAAAIPTVLVGARLGHTQNPDLRGRTRIDNRSRAFIFLAPAMLFIGITLVIPTIRTIYLSFLDRESEDWVGLGNYTDTLRDPVSWDSSNWADFFTSRLFYIGGVLLIIALITGVTQKRRTGRAVELGNPTMAPLLVGGLLLAFALFTALRGTIINNLWWVVTVTFATTAIGLAVAVLADGAKGEKVSKSIIFMPMAISLVGASIIWRFMYVPRDRTRPQTGLLNALWVGLGRLSTGSGLPTLIIGVLVAAALLGLLVVVARALVRRDYGKAAFPGIVFVLLGWFFLRYVGSSGIGGVEETAAGVKVADPIGFIQESPYNNFWLMVILIWIQVGFAMVILSAAIKAVPEELLEAARVDGATRSQIFWRVTLPQIATTIGVVVTTLIVLVMKVFDIVKVVTNGNFGTQVLANDMYLQAFQFTNRGRGAALAVILFVSVLPVMYLNIRRMQREA